MNSGQAQGGRVRMFLQFIAAILYFLIARMVAAHGASGLVGEEWFSLAEQAILVFLLLLGYAGMGFTFSGQMHPVSAQGLTLRAGWRREAGMGLAVGWALVLLCVLPMTLIGGIAIHLSMRLSSWGWLIADIAYFALLTLAEEVAFRGYGFQRLANAANGVGAAVLFSFFYALMQSAIPGSNNLSIAVSFVFGLVLSAAYLRTRALWVSWGLNFGWKACRALVFGLAISGVNSHSPIVQGDPMGPFWLTGGGFGVDASRVALVGMIVALYVVVRLTRELNYVHNAPVIVAGGVPVDIDEAMRRQHEAAMADAQPTAPSLVQILPVVQSVAQEKMSAE